MTAVLFVTLESTTDEEIKIVEHEVTGSSYNPLGSVVGVGREESIHNGAVVDACSIMALCNDARLIGHDNFQEGKEKDKADREVVKEVAMPQYTIEGEPTEAALLCLLEKLGPISSESLPSINASQNYRQFVERWDRYATLEFDRKRKSMSVLVTERNKDESTLTKFDQTKLLVKGAPGMLLQRCTHVKLRDGMIVPISLEVRDQIDETIRSIGGRALRCIGLAVKDGKYIDDNLLQQNKQYNEALKDSNKFADIETGLTFVGMVAIKDPPRPGVSSSIDLCKQAGIRVIMITGDSKATAVAIAKDVHVFGEEENSMHESCKKAFEGKEFFAMSQSEQLGVLNSGNSVICRAEPSDKQKLVKMLQSLGEISAMTGDGVNDAPALQQANIGVAMGISGTEVAKEAADMVLVDDNVRYCVYFCSYA